MGSESTANTSTSITKNSAFIDDGFMVSGLIEERPNLTPEVRLTYRPLGWMDRDKANRGMDDFKGGSDDQHEYRAKRLLERIERWSLSRPLTLSTVKVLHPFLFDVMEAMIFGLRGPDKLLTPNEVRQVNEVRNDIKN